MAESRPAHEREEQELMGQLAAHACVHAWCCEEQARGASGIGGGPQRFTLRASESSCETIFGCGSMVIGQRDE